MNKIQIIGRLTGDPELKTTPNGVNVCKFTVAVNRRFNRDETDFFPVTVWREAAVACNNYLVKGNQVAVAGACQIRHYEDKNGVKHIAVDVQAEEVEFLTPQKKIDRETELEEVEDGGEMPF